MGFVGDEHAAAAIAGQFEIVIPDRLHGLVETDKRDLIAPRRNTADLVTRTGLGDGDEVALFADCRRVQRQPAMVIREVAHLRLRSRVLP